MKSFNKLSGIVASLPQLNIDTDAIIPKQFLKTIERTGLGKHLFHEKRYSKENNLNENFVLNQEPWNKSKFIVAGDNFGCGSSREHAPWAQGACSLLEPHPKLSPATINLDLFHGS